MTGLGERVTSTTYPFFSINIPLPSKFTTGECETSGGTRMAMMDESGMTMGRKERECGQMGVISIAGTEGWTMDPPDEAEKAEEPVAEAMIMPHPCTRVV